MGAFFSNNILDKGLGKIPGNTGKTIRDAFSSGTKFLNAFDYRGLMYPLDLDSFASGQNHMIVFHIWKRDLASQSLAFHEKTDIRNDGALSLKNVKEQYQKIAGSGSKISSFMSNLAIGGRNVASKYLPNAANDLKTDIAEVLERSSSATTLIKETIAIHMPTLYTDSYSAYWNPNNLAVKNWLTTGSFADFAKQVFGSIADASVSMMNDWFDKNVGNDLETLISAGLGVVKNPWQEQLFQHMNFRNFNFDFHFRPRNEKEAENVYNIIQAFRWHMHPEVSKDFSSRYLIYPDEFSIEFYASGKLNRYLSQIGMCVLTDMNVNYSDSGVYSTHRVNARGASATTISLSLKFTEVELLTRNRIDTLTDAYDKDNNYVDVRRKY
jgi:hypothetical protein